MTGPRRQMRSLVALFVLVVVMLMFPTGSAAAEEFTMAAASDLNFAIKESVAEYEKQTGHHVRLSLGSFGHFYSQI